MRVMDGAGQFHFENLIKRFNCLCCGFLVHASSCYYIDSDAKTQRHNDVCRGHGGSPHGILGSAPMSPTDVFVSLYFYCAFEVTVFPIGEWSGIAETPSS